MKNLLVIWRRELGACFLSPVAYVFMVVFLSMTGWVFLQMVEGNVGSHESLAELLFKVIVYFWMPILVTVITMRLFAEEKRSGTLETLMTAPVAERDVVLGKYLGALSFLFVVTAPTIACIFLLDYFSPGIESVDVVSILTGAFLVGLLSAFCVAIGLVISLMTHSQIVAAICCFCGVLLPLMAGYIVSRLTPGSGEMAAYLSAHDYLLDFSRGVIDTRPVVLYVSGTAFLVFTAIRILESRRWK
jgi:ABC-2 type transport system permease protein